MTDTRIVFAGPFWSPRQQHPSELKEVNEQAVELSP